MKLQKSEDNEPILVTTLSKAEQAARGGKYIKRVPYYVNGKRKFRYYYRESAAARDVTVGETVKLGKRVAEVLGIDKDGKITIREGKRKRTVTADQWSKLMAKHYGDRYFEWAEKRASQTVNAVLRHVPREMLADLKGSDAERMAQLEKRVPEVYAKLRASFQRSGVSPFEAKRVLGTVLERKGWEPEARAAVIGNVIEHRNMAYRQTIQGAENLAGGGKVKAGHVQAMADILAPPDKSLKAEVDDLASKAETELAALSAALAKARDGSPEDAAKALEEALNSPAMARLALVAQAMPGLKDKAIEPTRDALAQVQAVIPRSQPTREGASAVVYVAGENGAPRALKARYKLVEASEAIASHDPNSFKQREGYPEGVQERAYHRDRDEQAKVMRNANKLNPAFLVNTNPDAVNGPPILDQNGVVLGGNSRTMSMQLAYEKHPDRAKELRAYMAAHAHETGFTPEDVKALKNPVLVRVVETTGTDDQKLLVRQMNESFTQGMDPRTMQVAMGRKLDDAAVKQLGDSMEADETLNAFLDSKRAEGFINALTRVGVIDQRNSNQYMVKGTKRLNEDGKQLVERVLVGRTVGDADLLSNTTAKIVGNIARSVPFMAQAKAHGATYDLGDDLKVALDQFNDLSFRARQGHRAALNADMSDKEFKGLFAQTEMFGERNPILDNPRAMTLLEVLIRKNGPQKMSAVFRDYAALAAQHPEDQDSMFGDKPSPEALLERAMKGDAKKSMEPTLIVKREPTLIVKARSILTPNIQVGEARGAPRFDTPPMPDYQGIYYPPEDEDAHKRERDHAQNRRQADAERARGKWGFHGKVLSAKPAIKWELDREESEPAFKQPKDRETGKPLRVSPKLNARTREEKGKPTYADADVELEGEGKPKSKRKKKKKRVRLTARKR
jgi:mRNA-degrading endonuclease HigB of HigAB toxin-antitoxin module